jgi:hypothetical protein
MVESKDEVKKRLGRSSDIADAFIMTFCAGVHPRPRTRDRPWDRDYDDDDATSAWAV